MNCDDYHTIMARVRLAKEFIDDAKEAMMSSEVPYLDVRFAIHDVYAVQTLIENIERQIEDVSPYKEIE